jgi:hypothetical protein
MRVGMPKLPQHARARIPTAKLRYCLDLGHPTGRHKARVFASALGLTIEDVPVLEEILRRGISEHEAQHVYTLGDGTQRWVVEWTVLGRLGPLRFVSAWDCGSKGIGPRLVSCYLKKVK